MRELIFHIGPHKTGTTAIQLALKQASGRLADAGIDYDPGGGPGSAAHHDIAELLRARDRRADAYAAIERAAGARPRAILSSENFSHQRADDWAALVGHFGDRFRIVVVCYLRSRAAAMFSIWQEGVKHGFPASLGERLGDELLRTTPSAQMDFAAYLEPLGAVPAIETRIVVYDNVVASGRDIAEHFVNTVVGVDPPLALEPASQANTALPATRLELLRCLHMLHRQRGAQRMPTLFGRLRHVLARDPEIAERAAEVEARLARHVTEIDLAPLDHRFRHIDAAVVATWRERVVNPAAREPFTLAVWPERTLRPIVDTAAHADTALWTGLAPILDRVTEAAAPAAPAAGPAPPPRTPRPRPEAKKTREPRKKRKKSGLWRWFR